MKFNYPATENTMGAPLDRRSFLKCALASGAAIGTGALAEPGAAAPVASGASTQSDEQFTFEARFYEKLDSRKIRCKLCPRECIVGDKERGYCGVRENRGGTYYTLVHSRVCAAHVDPIEKKPLFHYLPGTTAFSIATAGCNVNCKFCQNWEISQSRPEEIPAQYISPHQAAGIARQHNCPTIAYTYSEPVVFAEYLMDTADAGHAAGVRSIVVSNGYMQHDALEQAYGKMDAVKIDLKAFTDSFYAKVVTGQLKPVLESLVTLRKMGKWTEIVYLVIPTLNDDDAGFRGLAAVDQDQSRPRRSAALHAVSSRVSAQESAHHAGGDAGARQGHRRRRGPALRLHRQRPRPSRAKHLLPAVPQDAGGARRLYRQPDAHPQGLDVPVSAGTLSPESGTFNRA